MKEELTLYIAARVKDIDEPSVPSFKVPCSKCGEDVWISQGLESYWAASDLKIVCTVCATAILKDHKGPHVIEFPPETVKAIIDRITSGEVLPSK